MAIVVGSSTSVASASRTTTTVTMPAGVAAGDEVRIHVGAGLASLTAPTITPPGTVTLVASMTYGDTSPWTVRLSEYRYRVTGSGDPSTFVFTTPTAYTDASAIAFTGVDATTPDDATPTSNSGSGTTATFTGLTVATTGAMLLGARGSWDGNAISAPGGWTETIDQPVTWVGYRGSMATGATGDVTLSAGNGSSQAWGTLLSVLRPAGGAPTGSITSATVAGGTATIDGTTSGAASLRWGDAGPIDPATTSGVQPSGLTGYTLAMSEEFTGSTVSVIDSTAGLVAFRDGGSNWGAWYPSPLMSEQGGHSNNAGTEKEWYDTSGLSLTSGNLRLTATLDHVHDSVSLPYTSGMIQSNAFLNVTSGFFEARIQSSAQSGAWPAFWIIPASYSWPPEVDIFDAAHGADYASYTIKNFGTSSTIAQEVTCDMSQWHVYGLDYNATTHVLKWYLDGTLIATEGTSTSIPTEPMYLVVNLAVKNTAVTTHTLDVDYVRVWTTQTVTDDSWASVTLPASHTYSASGTYEVDLGSDGVQVDSTTVTIGAVTYPARSTWYSKFAPRPTASVLGGLARVVGADMLLGTAASGSPWPLTCTTAATSSSTSALTGLAALSSTTAAVASAASTPTSRNGLASTTVATADGSSAPTRLGIVAPLTSTTVAASTTTSTLLLAAALTATAAAIAGSTSTPTAFHPLTTTTAATASASSTPTTLAGLAATTVATSATTTAPTALHPLTATSTAAADGSSSPTVIGGATTWPLTSTTAATAGGSSTLHLLAAMGNTTTATAGGSSTVTARLVFAATTVATSTTGTAIGYVVSFTSTTDAATGATSVLVAIMRLTVTTAATADGTSALTIASAYLPLVDPEHTRTVPARDHLRTVDTRDTIRTAPARDGIRTVDARDPVHAVPARDHVRRVT